MAVTPQEAIDQADEAFNRGDLDAVLSYYEEHAVWLVTPGHIVSGIAALRKEFGKMFRSTPHVRVEKSHVIECGDLALCSSRWSLAGTASDARPLNQGGFASTILRRQADGHWKIVIDNTCGPAIVGSDSVSP